MIQSANNNKKPHQNSNCHVTRRKYPSVLWIVITYKCNSKCFHCYADNTNNNSVIESDTIENICHLLSYNYFNKVILIGGEPTLYADICNLINDLRHYCSEVSIVTNGKYFNSKEYISSLLNSGLTSVDISIGNEINYFETPSKMNEQQMSVKNALDLLGDENVSAIITIGNINVDSILTIIKMLERVGLKKLAVNLVIPTIKNPKRVSEISCSLSEIANKYKLVYDYICGNTNITPLFYMNIPLCLFDEKFLAEVFSKGHAVSGCHVISGDGLVIDPFGNILPCTHWVDTPSFNIDKSFDLINTKDKFEHFWCFEKPRSIAEDLCKYRSEKCIDCHLYGAVCLCGCPLLWLAYSPHEEIKGFDREYCVD